MNLLTPTLQSAVAASDIPSGVDNEDRFRDFFDKADYALRLVKSIGEALKEDIADWEEGKKLTETICEEARTRITEAMEPFEVIIRAGKEISKLSEEIDGE